MENQDLVKKLEDIKLPEIETRSHEARLRMALLNSDYFKRPGFWETLKKYSVFAAPALALFVILVFTVVRPKLTEAKVLGIAKNNPDIQKIIEDKNMVLGEIKIKDDKAYVLLSRSSDTENVTKKNSGIKIQKTSSSTREYAAGAVIEVDLKQKKVNRINSINREEINSLNNKEKKSAEDIANSNEIIGDIIPSGAKIEKIQSSLSQKIHLEEKGDGVKAVSEDKNNKKADVQYDLNGRKWVVKVNLEEKRVEEINYSSDNQENNNKGRD
jgi:hypothetical protein